MSRQVPYENMAPGTIATKVVAGIRPPIDHGWEKQVQQVIKFSWDGDSANRIEVLMARKMLEDIDIGDPDSMSIRPQHLNFADYPSSTSNLAFVTMDIANAALVSFFR